MSDPSPGSPQSLRYLRTVFGYALMRRRTRLGDHGCLRMSRTLHEPHIYRGREALSVRTSGASQPVLEQADEGRLQDRVACPKKLATLLALVTLRPTHLFRKAYDVGCRARMLKGRSECPTSFRSVAIRAEFSHSMIETQNCRVLISAEACRCSCDEQERESSRRSLEESRKTS